MIVVVDGVVVAVHEVPAAPVVDEVVPVVVGSVHRVERVHPALRREIGMAEVDARVRDGHHDVRVARRDVPRFGSIDVLVARAARLPVLWSPQSWLNEGSFGVSAIVTTWLSST